jgi:hypothetical protein
MGSGVENCWKRSISSERRVCVGNRPATLARIGSRAAGEQRAAELPQEEDQRRLASFIGKLPVPGAIGIGAAEGPLHLKPQAQRVDL